MTSKHKLNTPLKRNVFVAMSGGVDSSVAALLLKRRGYNVIGVFMRCFNLDGCAERDAEDARRVAEKLKIPFYVWDFEDEYKKKVVEYMVKGYKKGITPNPDVMCNKEIKFGLFLKKALQMGAPACRQAGIYVATGHYVRAAKLRRTKRRGLACPATRSPLDSRPRSLSASWRIEPCPLELRDTFLSDEASPQVSLLEAKDKNKDQSYFLWTLTQKQLKHCLFPIGDYLKSEVREIAKKAGLPTAEKKDSQGICFIGKVSLDDFLKKYIPEKKGDVLNVAGEKIGEHKGAQFYTIGQRHGLGIGGSEKPYYIVEKNVKKNIIIVAEGDKSQELYRNEINLIDVNFINPNYQINQLTNKQIFARVRYRQPLVLAVLKIDSPAGGSKLKIVFDAPVKFIAPGQSAVFYEYKKNPSTSSGLKMLGGGIIDFMRR